MTNHKSAQSNKGATNDIDEKIMAILNAHTFKDQFAYSPGLVDDLLAALANLIAQETNKARLDELTWARDMAEKDITGHSLISLNYVNQRIQALTADKEPKNG